MVHEYSKYSRHLKSLDSESKLLRFGHKVSDEYIDKLCNEVERDPLNHILFCIEDRNLTIIAIGHIATKGEMELAFSVLKEHQGQGLGDKLMKRCIQYCRTHNILRGAMVCLASNDAIKHLCIKNGIRIRSEYGETMAEIELPQPQVSTYVKEQFDVNLEILDYFSKRFIKLDNRLPQ